MAVGIVDPTQLLSQMEKQIMQAKQEALTKKEILEKMEKCQLVKRRDGLKIIIRFVTKMLKFVFLPRQMESISFILCSKRLVVLWDCILK